VSAVGVPVSLARELRLDSLPVGGVVDAEAELHGALAETVAGRARFTHRDGAVVSSMTADGSIVPSDSMRLLLDLRFHPVSMELVQHITRGVDLRGAVTGTAELRGAARNLAITASIDLPAGTVDADGTLDLRAAEPAYTATVQLRGVDVNAMAPALPMTALTGEATLIGQGLRPATMTSRLTVGLRDLMVDSTAVGTVIAIAATRGGRLTIDTLRVQAPYATATASGSFGIVEGIAGSMDYHLEVSTLAGFERWIRTGDTTQVHPRSLVSHRARARSARADSLRQAAAIQTGDIDSLVAGGQRALRRAAAVTGPEPLRRDSVAGSMDIKGRVDGGWNRFTARAAGGFAGIVFDGIEIRRGTLDATWADVRTPDATLTAAVDLDSAVSRGQRRGAVGRLSRGHRRVSAPGPIRTSDGSG
jgi:hypothetical protein